MDMNRIEIIKVPLYRRVLAITLDGVFILIGLMLFWICTFKIACISTFNVESKAYDLIIIMPAVILTIIFIVIDQIVLPSQTGYTASRWLCNYKIRNKVTKTNPSYIQCVGRYLTIYLLESIALSGFVSLVTCLFRRDNAALHDLITKTEVTSIKKASFIGKFKPIIILLIIFIVPLVCFSLSISVVDNAFALPVLKRINSERDFESKPKIELKKTNNVYYSIAEIPIIQTKNVKEVAFKNREYFDDGASTYVFTIDKETFVGLETKVLYEQMELFSNFFYSKIKLNDIAKESILSANTKYNPFTPIKNTVKIMLRLIWCVYVSGRDNSQLEYSAYNDTFFMLCSSVRKNNELGGVEITMYRGLSWKILSIIPKEKNSSSNRVLTSIISDLQTAQTDNLYAIEEVIE